MKNVKQIPLKRLYLIGLLLLTVTGSLYAQSESQKFFWIDLGLGAGSVGEEGVSVNLSGTYQLDRNLLTVRIVGCGELFGKSLNDYSFLYSRAITTSKILTSVGIGLGMVDGFISQGLFTDEPEKIKMIIGLPFEAQFIWRPFSFLGIGLYGFANVNSEESFYGYTISLQVGKLR